MILTFADAEEDEVEQYYWLEEEFGLDGPVGSRESPSYAKCVDFAYNLKQVDPGDHKVEPHQCQQEACLSLPFVSTVVAILEQRDEE